MFVTSDIFDLERVGRFRDLDWRENLLGGVDIQGTDWRGYRADALFLLEAAKRCGLVDEMRYAGYNKPGQWRTRPISPKSFGRLARGELRGAWDAESVLLRGERDAIGADRDYILLGGSAHSIRHRRGPTGAIPLPGPPWRSSADFIFPLDEDLLKVATDLFAMAVEILGAEYGYAFVRDDLCGPNYYMHGITAPLDYKALATRDGQEIGDWADYVAEGRLWSERAWFRDLFAVNLLSERHARTPIDGLGLLPDWIEAEPGRGRISGLNHGRWLWTLTDAEMVTVRPRLNEAGLLLSCRPRVYRDLPGGGPDTA